MARIYDGDVPSSFTACKYRHLFKHAYNSTLIQGLPVVHLSTSQVLSDPEVQGKRWEERYE